MKPVRTSAAARLRAGLVLPLVVFASVTSVAIAAAPKLALARWMVLGETAQADLTAENAGDASALVDEQTLAGDPLAGTGGAPIKHWFPGWDASRYPAHAILDLRAEYDLTEIYLRDTNGGGNVIVSAGVPFAWTPLFTDGLGSWNTWNRHTVAVRTRYLRITLTTTVAPEEIVLYGTIAPGQTPQAEPLPVAHPRPPMDQLIGTNAFIDDPLGVIEHAGNVREYHPWQWDEGDGGAYPGFPANQNAWSPAWGGGGAWDFDAYYRNLAGLGLTASPAVWQTPSWLRGTGTNEEMKPIPLGAGGVPARDAQLPASYVEHADHLFQFMARYGAAPVLDSRLKLRADQARLSGLGSLRYLENWNEQDKWWRGREAYFNPFECAALCSADYDGHLGAMGATVGVKNADPNARLVMGGLALPQIDYLRAMRLWIDFQRGGDVPFAALNLHHYCNDSGGQTGTPTTGISPEADDLRGRMAAFRDYRDRYFPGRELWLSEFGWDRHSGSDQRAPAIAGDTAEEVKARWIVRAWLELAAAGLDRGHQFMLRDVSAPGAIDEDGRFNTSGLVGPKGSWALHAGWYYQATLRQRLRGLHYLDDLALSDPQLRAYRFADELGHVRAIAAWSATATGRTVTSVALPVPAGSTRATKIEFTDGQLGGTTGELTIAGGQVVTTLSEKPVLVLLEGRNTRRRLPDRRMTLTAAQMTSESAVGNPTLLVDEQAAVGNPDFGAGGLPSTNWQPGYSAAFYPAFARLDLGLRRRVTKVYLHDYASSGAFDLEIGAPGKWTFLAEDRLTRYAAWSAHVVPERTRHVRFTMHSNGANVAEVAIYAQHYSGYGDWAERAFPGSENFAVGEASPAADFDGDGVSHLLEYVLGGDPRKPESDLAPVVGVSGGNLTLTYVRDLWLGDVAWQVEWSTDLQTWSSAGVAEVTELATADFERRRAEVASAGRAKLFLRLKATLTAAP